MATPTPPSRGAGAASADTAFFGHPRGLSTLFFTEMWERFAYYGLRGVLIVFMTASVATGGLGFDTAKAGAIYGTYVALVYLLSLPGGWVADRLLGLRQSVFYGGVMIMLGQQGGPAQSTVTPFKIADADAIAWEIAGVVAVAPISSKSVTAIAGNTSWTTQVTGSTNALFTVRSWPFTAGRPFSDQELRTGTPVAVIGSLIAEKLFEGVDPIGKNLMIGGLPYRVVGVVAKQGTLFGISLDKFVVMPFTAPARRMICPINVLDHLIIQADGPQNMLVAMGEVEAIMRTKRQLKPAQENNFFLQTPEGALEGWKKISGILITALPLLVSISLIVGGIVIMNIMLMAVAERTREIGIRKALGARRRDILAQFVVESATLSFLGAAVGIATGIGLAYLVRAVTPLPAAVAPWSIVLGTIIGVTVGVVAGVYPASQAAKLDTIVALRAE